MSARPQRKPAPEPEPEIGLSNLPAIASMAQVYDATRNFEWVIRDLLPSPGVVMFSGPPSSLKTYIVMALCLSSVYGAKWPVKDKERIKEGLAFYCAGENVDELPVRHRAWLRANGKPESVRVEDGFNSISVQSGRYNHSKFGPNSPFDPLDTESVQSLIDMIKVQAGGKPVSIVVMDTLTSLLSKSLKDEVCRILVKHMYMIAHGLSCSVIMVNHTHRNDEKKSQGSFVLANIIDGDFMVIRDEDYKTNNEKTGLRSTIKVNRLKRCRDQGLAYEFLGKPITLGADDQGMPIDTLTMYCTGLAEAAPDNNAIRRAEIAQVLPYARISIAGVIKACGWDKGGVQYEWVRQCIPMDDWTTINLTEDGKKIAKQLRRVKKGISEYIECRIAEEAAPAKEEKKDEQPHVDEPEIAQMKGRKAKDKANGKVRPLNTVTHGAMLEGDFDIAMETPLAGDDPKATFFQHMAQLRQNGAAITPRGEEVLKYLEALGNNADSMKTMLKVFTTTATMRSVLQAGGRRVQAPKPRKAAKKKEDAPKDEGEQPSA